MKMEVPEKYWWLPVLVLCSVWIPLSNAQQSVLTVLAPNVVRPHSDYVAAVALHGGSSRTDEIITVEVKDDKGTYQKTKTVPVRNGVSTVAKISIGDLLPGDYSLSVYGSGSLISFRQSKKIYYSPKSLSMFIQLDRAVYKPGITVNFRVIVLDSHLRPITQQFVDVLVTDGNGNEVRRWDRVVTHFGCFIGDVPLSHSPVFGEWNIKASVGAEAYNKTFMVADYVLPKFQVMVNLPKHASFREAEELSLTVKAKYANDRPVKGELTISAYPTYHTEILQPVFRNPVRKVVLIDGETTIPFNLITEFGIYDDFQRIANFDIEVEETLTGIRQNATATILLHKYSNRLELLKPADTYQPGLKFKPMLKVTKFDGSPLDGPKNAVKVKAGFTHEGKDHPESVHTLNDAGMVELSFEPPLEANTSSLFEIEAEYPDANLLQATVGASLSPSRSYMQLKLKTRDPKINEDVEVEIVSSVGLPHLTYVVMGRGEVLVTRTISQNLLPTDKSITVKFLATLAMAPVARVIAFFVAPGSQEIVAGGLDIKFANTLQNFVTVNMSPQVESRPGSEVTMTFFAKPYSHMAIMGVDEEVQSLGNDYNLSPDMILDDVESYSGMSEIMQSYSVLEKSYFYSSSQIPEKDRDIFDKYAAIILSNGQWYKPTMMANPRDQPQIIAGVGSGNPVNPNFPTFGATRPPLAGPYAFSRIPAPTWNYRPRVHLLSEPANTWFFTNVSSGADGKVTLRRTLPDSMTSWIVSALSLDPVNGIGLLRRQITIIGKRPFYINVDFPHSVILGEVIAVSVAVTNNMNQDLNVDLSLDNSEGHLEFIENSKKKFSSLLEKKTVVLVRPSLTVVSVFMAKPKQIGAFDIKVYATTSTSLRDSKSRRLLVKPEGETIYMNKAVFVDLRYAKQFTANLTMELPHNFVADSEMISVSSVGDLLGHSISNLAKLIRMPTGCGEQNMAKLVPNIIVLEYLKNTKQLTTAVERKAIELIEMGYQQQLSYRRRDGSFSSFGSKDPSGSTWLTAFVARYLARTSFLLDRGKGQLQLLFGSKKVIEDSLAWLKAMQAPNGSFPEVGAINYDDMQGNMTKALPLTAYTLLTFIESQKTNTKPIHQNIINKALDYIVKNLDGLEDPYAISLCSYALHMARHPVKETAFHLLEAKAKTNGTEKWWSKEVSPSESKNPWIKSSTRAANVEMTAYALLTYLERGLLGDALPIANWLISQQNSLGGFASTQDTTVGITALAKLGEIIQPSATDMSVVFSHTKKKETLPAMHITKENALVVQKAQIPQKARDFSVEVKGSGIAVVQLSYQYNLNVTGAWPLFTLDPQVDKNSNVYHLQLSVCSGFVGGNMSNMALMEVVLPSGFYVDGESLPSLRVSPSVKRVETQNGGNSVSLYFDQMGKKENCPTVSAYKTHGVAWNEPVPVMVYDYYDMTRKARVFYKPVKSGLCDVCNADSKGADCLLSCGPQTQNSQSEKSPGTAEGSTAGSSCRLTSQYYVSLPLVILAMKFSFRSHLK
ncbi:thioester-containing protein 1 allele R1 [Hetaerina americana]|uniref:thioester-containing protein 1 allele R1 n=1 Tax=Hetaerina americana TaxID=62018 RepID=UPI003A7F352E